MSGSGCVKNMRLRVSGLGGLGFWGCGFRVVTAVIQ